MFSWWKRKKCYFKILYFTHYPSAAVSFHITIHLHFSTIGTWSNGIDTRAGSTLIAQIFAISSHSFKKHIHNIDFIYHRLLTWPHCSSVADWYTNLIWINHFIYIYVFLLLLFLLSGKKIPRWSKNIWWRSRCGKTQYQSYNNSQIISLTFERVKLRK